MLLVLHKPPKNRILPQVREPLLWNKVWNLSANLERFFKSTVHFFAVQSPTLRKRFASARILERTLGTIFFYIAQLMSLVPSNASFKRVWWNLNSARVDLDMKRDVRVFNQMRVHQVRLLRGEPVRTRGDRHSHPLQRGPRHVRPEAGPSATTRLQVMPYVLQLACEFVLRTENSCEKWNFYRIYTCWLKKMFSWGLSSLALEDCCLAWGCRLGTWCDSFRTGEGNLWPAGQRDPCERFV